ncbi:succinate-semialdehyde dehydrogenase NADP+ [Stachybotrys elegans]|uniref:Succinate-semialdehyde dehydrogenase n=1 Tax=Stachybotrys elegans TaxID=80388 RepID=A0A8K0SX52_9HYPO|nr:succinate-semialdehyde dehydrogenase NADP+ [Stachybotrys elegans]
MVLLTKVALSASRLRPAYHISLISLRRASTMAPKLRDPTLLKQGLCYINGEWTAAKSGKTFQVHDPASGELIGSCAECDADDTQIAIQAAVDAFASFRKLTGRERSRLLRKWYDLMADNSEDIAKLITWENGKPLADAKGEAAYAASFFEWFSEEAPRTYGDVIPATVPTNRVWTVKEPVGVCGLITPWNFPAAMITRKIGPALAAGCTVVCKAPGETPYTALALAELSQRAGIPKGVVNIVTAHENTPAVGEALTSSPVVRKVSFTGSTGVGKLLMKQSSDTLKKLSFELGGNAPFIVFDDADIDAAVAGAIASKFRSSGQTCVCANRIYVQQGIYDEFVEKFADKVKGFKVGRPFDEGTTHGPLIHERAVSKVQAHIKDAQSKGGKVIVGGQLLPDLGSNFVQPTVIRDMTPDMALASEETFGPVAGLFPFQTEEEVVKLANQAEVGLAGYFFSRDLERVYRVAESLEVGMVGVNTGLISDTASPFGGVKHSGFGREGSMYGISEYQVIKTVTFGGMGKPLQS